MEVELKFFVYAFLLFIVLFFLFRELLCWYWKINKHIQVEEEILETLKRIESKLDNRQ